MIAACQEPELATLRQFLTEARTVNQALADENLQLKNQLKDSQEELTRLRSRYASMVVENDRRALTLARMEASAAALLRGADAEGERLQLLEILGDFRKKLLEASERHRMLMDTVTTVVNVCQPSDALRSLCEKNMAECHEALEECLMPLAAAEPPVNGTSVEGTIAIAAVDAQAGMVRIDRGEAAGLKVGKRLGLVGDNESKTVLRVVITRRNAAVALLEEGDAGKILPGLLLKPLAD